MDASTTFTANMCYADNACIADGATSPSRACFKCESSKSQTGLTGPITGPGTDHCYIDGVCIPKRTGKPWYHLGNSDRCAALCLGPAPALPPPDSILYAATSHSPLAFVTACASNAIPM